MLILPSDKKRIVSTEQMTQIKMQDAHIVLYFDPKERGVTIGEYETPRMATVALCQLAAKMKVANDNTVIEMPSVKEVQSMMLNAEQKSRYLNGAKTKGHGGS